MSRGFIAALLFLLPAVGSPAASRWIRLTSPHFELNTLAGEKAGRDAVLFFEQVRDFYLQASPVRVPDGFPVRIVTFNGQAEFLPYSLRASAIAYYVPTARRDYIVMADLSADSYKVAVHEYMHLIVQHSGLRLPIWLNEGWADVYSSMHRVKDGMAVGDLIPGRMQALQQTAWLNLDTLTSVGPGSPIYNEGDRTGIFYGESWALAHMLFLSPEYKDKFPRFVAALHRGGKAGEAFEAAYGKSTDQVYADLQLYFRRKKLYGAVFQTKAGKTEEEPLRSVLSDFTSRLILADLQAALGRGDLARREYEDLEKLQPADPDLAESLGFLALGQKDAGKAREYFSRAYVAGVGGAQMCFSLAMLEAAAKQSPGTVIPILERALKARPDYPEALLELGIQHLAARQYDAAIRSLMSIPRVRPEGAAGVFLALAYAYLESGDLAKAGEYAEKSKQWAKTESEVSRLNGIQKFIEARRKMAPPPQPGEKLEAVAGIVQALECGTGGNRLVVQAGQKTLGFVLPEPDAVEFSTAAAAPLSLQCGPQKPFRVVLEFAPASAAASGSAGVIRRLDY